MHPALLKYFHDYPQSNAPFMHQQLAEWTATRPLAGLRVLHHVPVVPNTLLKIACLIEAGADVTVTNPSSFCKANPTAVASLDENAHVAALEAENIVTSSRGGNIRVSPHFYDNYEDVEKIIAAFAKTSHYLRK